MAVVLDIARILEVDDIDNKDHARELLIHLRYLVVAVRLE